MRLPALPALSVLSLTVPPSFPTGLFNRGKSAPTHAPPAPIVAAVEDTVEAGVPPLPPAPVLPTTLVPSADTYSAYGAAPLPPLPPPNVAASSSGGGLPSWFWVAVGIAIATAYQKITSFVKGGGAQTAAANLMMQQMMKQAAKAQGAGGGAAPPFPFPGAAGGAGVPPFGFPPPPPTAPTAATATVDTTATFPGRPTSAKFEAVKAREAAAKGGGGSAQAAPATPTPSTPPKKKAAFVDVDDEPSPVLGGGGGGGDGAAAAMAAAAASAGGASSSSSSESGSKFSSTMVDSFFRDPSVQQMLYEHLPEPMRNPETFEWVLNNPENRKQLEKLIEAQGANLDPSMQAMLSGVSGDDVSKRLESLGVTPADMLQKIMGEPELAAAIQKPKVMQAIMEMQTNPMAFVNYQEDEDVMLVLKKLSSMFGGPMAAAAAAETQQ